MPSEKIITIKFKLNGEVTKETKSARAVIQEAVDRMKMICDKLSADKGECKKLLLGIDILIVMIITMIKMLLSGSVAIL